MRAMANMRAIIEHMLRSLEGGPPDGETAPGQPLALLRTRIAADFSEALDGDVGRASPKGAEIPVDGGASDGRLQNDITTFLDQGCPGSERDKLIAEFASLPPRRAALESAAVYLEDFKPSPMAVAPEFMAEAAAVFAPAVVRPAAGGTLARLWSRRPSLRARPVWVGIAATFVICVVGNVVLGPRSPLVLTSPPLLEPQRAPAPLIMDSSRADLLSRVPPLPKPNRAGFSNCGEEHEAFAAYRMAQQVQAHLESSSGTDFVVNRDSCEQRAHVETARPVSPVPLQPDARHVRQSSASHGPQSGQDIRRSMGAR
jgi:hypothetical protein